MIMIDYNKSIHISMMPPRAVCRSPPYIYTLCSDSTVTSSNFYTFLARQHRLHAQQAKLRPNSTTNVIPIRNKYSSPTKSYSFQYSSYTWRAGALAVCTKFTVNCLGSAKEVVPLPCHARSQLKLPSYLTISPFFNYQARFSTISSAFFSRTFPFSCMGLERSNTCNHYFPFCLKTLRVATQAVMHPQTDIPSNVPSCVKCNQGCRVFISLFSIRTPLATNPLSRLLDNGERAMPAQPPSCYTFLGPNSNKNTNPFAIPFGQGAQWYRLHVVMMDGNLPAAYAQSSKVPVAGYTTSSMVPVLNAIRPSFLLSPPSLFSIAAMALKISYQSVWLLLACVIVPQLQEISAPLPPLCRATVRSNLYFLNNMSRMCVAVVQQHCLLPSIGKSLLTSILPGNVSRFPCAKPEGFATGKYMILSALRCLQAYRRVCGPMNSSPCMPDTKSTVRRVEFFAFVSSFEVMLLIPYGLSDSFSTLLCRFVDSKQQNWHLAPQHCSPSIAICDTSKTCSLGTIANHSAMYYLQSLQRLKGTHCTPSTNSKRSKIALTNILIMKSINLQYTESVIKSDHPSIHPCTQGISHYIITFNYRSSYIPFPHPFTK